MTIIVRCFVGCSQIKVRQGLESGENGAVGNRQAVWRENRGVHLTLSLCRLTDKQWGEGCCVSHTLFVHTEQTGSVEGKSIVFHTQCSM